MAKAKINYDDVKKVCEQILADDEEPTARSVRAILGVGSMQTVLGFIQDWNKTRTLKEITAESIDKKLLQLINETVSDSVKFGMSKIQEELVKATLERNDMSAEFLRLENEYNISIGEIERYKIDNTKAEERCRNLQENLAEAKSNILTLFDFAATIDYSNQLITIESLKTTMNSSGQVRSEVQGEINSKKSEIQQLKNAQKDEANGAQLVNKHLQSFFGNQFLSLQPKAIGGHEPQIYFEVIRDGAKAYHLSEGECSLLAFCYFLAKLDDTNTKNKKPIIWIDDPISSLDSNHVFFVYSMINSEIVMSAKFEQLFISTHNLDFLKYLKRLKGANQSHDTKEQNRTCQHFVLERADKVSTLKLMPRYLKDYVTEFNYLFEQIYKCANLQNIDQSNYMIFYNFGNNARKFLEIYLYYKYPNHESDTEKQNRFFEGQLPSLFVDRINNEYSHIAGIFERGQTPIEVPEMQQSAKLILDRIKATDIQQFNSLLLSIGVTP